MTPRLVAIAAGGALGALLRYGITGLAHKHLGSGFAYGTLAANVLGCFAMGLLFTTFRATAVSETTRLLVLVGMLGAFTTFSTYGMDTVELARRGAARLAVLNVVLSNTLGVGAVLAGIAVGSRLAAWITLERR